MPELDIDSISLNLDRVRARVAAAARAAGRDPSDVTLVAVSKTMPVEAVRSAWLCGQRDFGENRVQEAVAKARVWRERWPSDPISWHLIGHIQSNKARDAVGPFDLIQSLDSTKLARALDERSSAAGIVLSALVEVHLSDERSKFGFDPILVEGELASFLALSGLRIAGLMTIAPLDAPGDLARPYFRRLRELRDSLADRFADLDLRHLSMGMSGDFEAAIAEGSTMVRIGRAIFGDRFQVTTVNQRTG